MISCKLMRINVFFSGNVQNYRAIFLGIGYCVLKSEQDS